MKTKEQILEGKYLIGDIVFNNSTPRECAEKLVSLINSQRRVILDYGDTQTGKSWNEAFDTTGRVSCSRGSYGLRWPILVYNARSMGGRLILTDCILSIKSSAGKRVIYQHPNLDY